MTPAEQNLIEDLFNRIRSVGIAARDAEADALINRLMLQTPGAAYALVQSVLVQDQALREAHQRIMALEQRQPANDPGGSFLGGAERQRWAASPTGPSVPLSAQQPPPSYTQPPYSAQPAQPAYNPQTPEPSGAGSFMRGALQTAAGVAGGALLFEGIRDLLHGGSGGFGGMGGLGGNAGGPWGGSETVVNNDTTINETVVNDDGNDQSDRSGLQTADDSDEDDANNQDWTDDTDDFDDQDNSV